MWQHIQLTIAHIQMCVLLLVMILTDIYFKKVCTSERRLESYLCETVCLLQ